LQTETGILFDPAYTGKAFYAYYENYLMAGKGEEKIFLFIQADCLVYLEERRTIFFENNCWQLSIKKLSLFNK
jgi:hypothetical protein